MKSPADNNEQLFHEQTDTFSLCVDFNDKKLTILLKDYVDWIIYED